MIQDIAVVRESISRIVTMLTMQSVTVTQRGSRAYVSYDSKTGAIASLNIPYIPDDAKPDFVAAIQGFLDHEVGHVLFSDSSVARQAAKLGASIAGLANIIEDVFVEGKMAAAFRGSSSNLESVSKFYMENVARPKIMGAIDRGDLKEAQAYVAVIAMRAWGGQRLAAEFLLDKKIAPLAAELHAAVGEELASMIGKCETSAECLSLAKKIKAKLDKSAPKPKPEPKPKPKSESKREPESKPSDDTAEKEGSELESPPGEESKDSEPEEGEEPAPDSDGKPSEDDAETGAEEGEKEEGKGEFSDEEHTSETDETGSGAGDEASSGDEGTSGGKPDSDSDAESEEDCGPSAGSRMESDEGEEGGDMPDSSIFEKKKSFDEEIADVLSKTSTKGALDSKYSVFSTEWDKVEDAPLCVKGTSVGRMEASVRSGVGVMQKTLERAMAAKAKKTWSGGKTRGRISPGALFKTASGDDRVFRTRFETKAKNTAVSLVVDCSGSMGGSRIELAGLAAFALSTVLERLKITHEVIGFTTSRSGEMTSLIRRDAEALGRSAHRSGWARVEPLYMPVFKSFAGRLDGNAKSRLASLVEHPDWLLQNVDGECVQIAARRLTKQRAERHIMIVMSDGQPCCTAGQGQNENLKRVVKQIIADGVEVIGIGIQTDEVTAFYPKNTVLNEVAELPARLMSELTKLLMES